MAPFLSLSDKNVRALKLLSWLEMAHLLALLILTLGKNLASILLSSFARLSLDYSLARLHSGSEIYYIPARNSVFPPSYFVSRIFAVLLDLMV